MVDKDWNAEALIDVGGPIGSLSDVLESEKTLCIGRFLCQNTCFDPSFYYGREIRC